MNYTRVLLLVLMVQRHDKPSCSQASDSNYPTSRTLLLVVHDHFCCALDLLRFVTILSQNSILASCPLLTDWVNFILPSLSRCCIRPPHLVCLAIGPRIRPCTTRRVQNRSTRTGRRRATNCVGVVAVLKLVVLVPGRRTGDFP
jgi:hypothetical protein